MADQQRHRSLRREGAEVKRVVKAVVTARVKALAAEGRAPRRGQRRAARLERFRRRLRRHWAKALDTLEELIAVSAESGDLIARAYWNDTSLFTVQDLLRQRACQVAWEVHTLCAAGYADGAYARWRTLDEIAVVMEFIHKFGGTAAERYLDHVHIKNRKMLREYEECRERLGYPPLSSEEVAHSERKKKEAIAKYNDDFGGEYGWAAPYCGTGKPTFFHVRKAAGYAFWKAHSGMASHAVHAGPHGILFRLGHPRGAGPAPLSGPSLIGLCDPLHATAIRVAHATFAFIQSVRDVESEPLESNVEHTARITYIDSLAKRVGGLAGRAHSRLDRKYAKAT